MQKVIAEIHLGHIRSNALYWKRRTGVKLCAVVKADAYGHGAEEVVFALSDVADAFAVALVEEGLEIRAAACGKDILVFTSPQTEEEAYTMIANGFLVTVPDLFTAKLLVDVCEKYRFVGRVHLKVNTGMNRYGMNPSMLGRVCSLLRRSSYIKVEGLYSHLYRCDEENALSQRELFLQMRRVCKRYFSTFIAHLGATYGAQLGEKFTFDMVRVGVGLYGYTPAEPIPELQKGMQVYTRVCCNRKYAFGGAGYGKVSLEKGARLAVCRAGYADGFLRRKENGLLGSEQNANALCMDVCLRVSSKKRGERVLLLTDADEIANKTQTISYEVLCAATKRAEKVYLY